MELRENVLLAPYTTFRIGGPARWFAEAQSEIDVIEAVEFARQRQLPLFILGGGSNLLVSDTGFAGLVLHVCMRGIDLSADGVFSVAAGENWDVFVSYAVERQFAGIECLAGIPGTVGGTPIQNVGAYGQEVAGTITRVRALDLQSMKFVEMAAEECGFAYRQSIFNTTRRNRYIVTAASFRLQANGQPLIQYADLARHFGAHIPTLQKTAAAVREIRRSKGMLLVPGEADCRSAGSFFKNPIVAENRIGLISEVLHIAPEQVPHYPAENGKLKLPAAWLLEQAGFHKGFTLGAAGISTRHTLALINRGDAQATDILKLRDMIVEKVDRLFGIHLETEPIFIGQ